MGTKDPVEIEAKPWGEFPGVRALAAAELQDGRFVVRLDSGRFECFLKRKASPYLFVLLSGARDIEAQSLPKFERWSWAAKFPGSIVCISDPTLYLRNEQLRIGWYVGTDERNWQLRLVGLVRTIAEKIGVETNKIICYGSSAGGFAGLMLASHLKDATAVAINPQTNVLKYSKQFVAEFLETCFSGRAEAELLPAERARLSAIIAFRRAPQAKCLIVQNVIDKVHYERHFKPFCSALQIPLEGGLSQNGHAMSWLYSHPNGHGREPSAIVDSLIATAVRLAGLQAGAAAEPASAGVPPLRIAARQLYLLNNRRQSRHKDSIEYFTPGRADLPSYPIQIPIAWNADPHSDRNWCAQLHMWRMIDNHLLDFERSADPEWLMLPIAIIDDWYDFHVARGQSSRFAWMDMMVGMRAMKLAFILSAHQAGVIQLRQSQIRAYDTLVDLHLEFLLDIKNVSYSNHTFIDMHGLAALGSVLRDHRKEKIDGFLRQIVPALIACQFNAEGVHLENSTGYQIFGINCLKRLKASCWFDAYGIDDSLRLATDVNALFQMPDGRCVPIGDTDGAPMTKQRECGFSAKNQLVNTSGYVIFRDDGNGLCADASYLFFMAAFNSRFHKQSDDLSCVWFEGEDILCDAGKFGYQANEKRGYAQSTRAHNTVEIDGKNSGDNFSKSPHLAYGSAVKQAQATDWGCIISGQLRHANSAVTQTRHMLYAHKKWLLVIDRMDGSSEHHFTQWFHFSPHLDLLAEDKVRFGAVLNSGKALSVIAASSGDMTASMVKGQINPVRQGWISQSYATLVPNAALGYSQDGKSVLFVTLLSIDDIGSAIRINDDNSVELSVLTRQGAERLEIAFDGAQCRARQAGAPL